MHYFLIKFTKKIVSTLFSKLTHRLRYAQLLDSTKYESYLIQNSFGKYIVLILKYLGLAANIYEDWQLRLIEL